MQKGIVISNKSNLYQVELNNNEIYTCNIRGKIKLDDLTPVAGDIVGIDIIDENNKDGVIEKIYNRNTYVKRPKMANISQIILVVSMKLPKPDLELLDKQLVYAEYLKIKPIIVLNKIDLEQKEKIEHIFNLYTNIGYIVIQTNAKKGIGLEEIKKYLKNNITAFSGNSGVGKSTLLNNIIGRKEENEGCISNKNKRGKNTTTQVNLYKIYENSYIADTPGFSTFEINEIEKNQLANYFIEFRPYIDKCEYVNCNHIKEENCGIKEAIKQKKISIERFERYCKIYSKIKEKFY